jgi:hypothetical protein
MPKKALHEKAFGTDGWFSFDPADTGFIEAVYKKTLREGEERLMLAVLENAVECFQKYVLARKPSRKQLFCETEEWFLDKENEVLYSFENICETLGLHPDYIRQGLLRWKEAKINSIGVQPHPASRAKLARTRIADTSVRFSKTA